MIFLLVVVGLMLSAGLLLLTQSQHAQSCSCRRRAHWPRAQWAEWGLWQVSDPDAALGLDGQTLPPCFATRR
jgi:hypothetical protein